MGWENACHRWFLEVLGYARNRSPMARIAQRVGIQDWRNGVCPEEVFQTEDGWKIRGCRPNNHPKKRLEQYSQLINQRPDWPERLKTLDLCGMYSSKKVQNRAGLCDRILFISVLGNFLILKNTIKKQGFHFQIKIETAPNLNKTKI